VLYPLRTRAGRQVALPWEFGLASGAGAGLLLTVLLGAAHVPVAAALIVLLAVPGAVGWLSGAGCGLLVAGLCQLMLIGFVQVGQGRLLFEPGDVPQASFLALVAVGAAVAQRARASVARRGRGQALIVPFPHAATGQADAPGSRAPLRRTPQPRRAGFG
jgi:hypothetical protein